MVNVIRGPGGGGEVILVQQKKVKQTSGMVQSWDSIKHIRFRLVHKH